MYNNIVDTASLPPPPVSLKKLGHPIYLYKIEC